MGAQFAVALLRLVQFLEINILQRNIATRFVCGEIFNGSFIANCPQSVPVKKLVKSVNI